MKKGFSMLRGILLAITLLLTLSACASATETETATPSPELSSTPVPTRTVSIEDLTAFATYRPTVPPSWTPATPSVTPIPSITPTRTPSPTATLIPEADLCNSFGYRAFAPQGFVIGVEFDVPRTVSIRIDILDDATGELLTNTVRTNEDPVILVFDPAQMPPLAYRWRATLQDATRSDLCPIEGIFVIPDPEATAESTQALNVTATSAAPTVPTATATPRIRSTEETGR